MQLPEPLLRRAGHQSGLLTTAQCLAAGITPDSLRAAVRSGRWESPYRGVYQPRPGRTDWQAAATAALLACGEPAALGYLSAARLIGLDDGRASYGRREPHHVCVPETRRITIPAGVRLHRVTDYAARLQRGSVPARTSTVDTVLDLAGTTDRDGAVSWVAKALRLELTTSELLVECLDRRGRHRHAADLREPLDDSGIDSAAELRFARAVEAAHGLPAGRRQVPDARWGLRIVDVEYDAQRVRVEIDGRAGHAGWAAQR